MTTPTEACAGQGHLRHPRHPRHLVGSKWSAVEPQDRERHWEVVSHSKKTGFVTMTAVLTSRQIKRPWRELRDREQWLPGWVPCPPEEKPESTESSGAGDEAGAGS